MSRRGDEFGKNASISDKYGWALCERIKNLDRLRVGMGWDGVYEVYERYER